MFNSLDDIHPKYVFVHGVLHVVSDFATLPPKNRPRAICPICKNEVILKLGKVRVHHYAHKSNVVCLSTKPETALHLNTKYYIYNQLLKSSKIFLDIRCSFCSKKKRYIWLQNWDEVLVEHSLGSSRPDITILKNGKPIGAIEVKVTHPVDEKKTNQFETMDIRWIEVNASESIYEGKNAWTPEKTLPFSKFHPEPKKWICNECKKRIERKKKEKEYSKHNYVETYSAKIVDYYFPSGKKYREVYSIKKRIKNDVCVGIYLQRRTFEVILSLNTKNDELALQKLKHAVELEKQKKEHFGAIVDDFMDWKTNSEARKLRPADFKRYPFRYSWDQSNQIWVFEKQITPKKHKKYYLVPPKKR